MFANFPRYPETLADLGSRVEIVTYKDFTVATDGRVILL